MKESSVPETDTASPSGPSAANPSDVAGRVPGKTVPHKRDLIAGLEKGLAVIAAFDEDHARLTMSEVAALCGLTRAAARRYLITLEHLGFVISDRKMYSLSPKVLRLAQSYMHSARLPRIMQPELQRLAFALKEAIAATVLDGDDVLCVAATNGGRPVSLKMQAGAKVPAHCTASGRVLLAAMPEDQLEAWVSRQSFARHTPQTVAEPRALLNEVARVRQQGYALVDQEFESGMRSLSVPLRSYRGDVVAALNVCVHVQRMTPEQLVQTCLPTLLQAQSDLRTVL